MPMLTGYGNDEPEMMGPEMMEGEMPQQQSDTMNAQSYGPSQGRTGADVIAGCLNQPTVRSSANGAGTTAPQGEMEFGADPGYGM